MGEGDPALEELIAGLEAASERLDGLILDCLSAAVQRGETTRPGRERQMTRARHVLERALHLLRQSMDSAVDEARD